MGGKLACIVGAGRSGSTLLAFLLNAHPQIVSTGEVNGPPAHLGARAADFPCSCGQPLRSCPFWTAMGSAMRARGVEFGPESWGMRYAVTPNRVAQHLLVRSLHEPHLDRLRDAAVQRVPRLGAQVRRISRRNEALVACALEIAGAAVFVDSSKDPARVQQLRRGTGLDVHVIHLVRDAPGYASSRLKNREIPVQRSIREWSRSAGRAQRLFANLPPDRRLRMRYEDLCLDTAGELRRVTAMLDAAPFLSGDIDFRAVEHHIIGNKMRLQGSSAEIRLDESWRERLSAGEQAEIIDRTRRWRRAFGYA